METLLVVEQPDIDVLSPAGVHVISAVDYLTNPDYSRSGFRVFNLCRSYKYKSRGYYVSLLAEARHHNPLPDVQTISNLRFNTILRLVSDDIEDVIQAPLKPLQSDTFTLSIYFGRNLAQKYDRLSLRLFSEFRAPLMRAEFQRKEGLWALRSIKAISLSQVSDNHRDFLREAAAVYFGNRRRSGKGRKPPRFNLAILTNPKERQPPSNPEALDQFIKAAAEFNIKAELIERSDLGRIATYDALFLRETTYVDNHTYRFASRAERDGLVVIDDPVSILRCTNKVFLHELLQRHRIPTPRSRVLFQHNQDEVMQDLGLPCILKLPDSSFSVGVEKAKDEASFREKAAAFLDESDLVIAQEFMPSEYDWRVGVIDGEAIFACKYYMAKDHWQIYKHPEAAGGEIVEGDSETMRVEDAPPAVIKTAVRAANLIGRSLYGVDLKQIGSRVVVIEINDNPNIDAGVEDLALGPELYRRIMASFNRRLEARIQPEGR